MIEQKSRDDLLRALERLVKDAKFAEMERRADLEAEASRMSPDALDGEGA